jgi:hypothetical protein
MVFEHGWIYGVVLGPNKFLSLIVLVGWPFDQPCCKDIVGIQSNVVLQFCLLTLIQPQLYNEFSMYT